MAYDTPNAMRAAAAQGQRVMGVAQDTAERAGAYLRRQTAFLSHRAQDLARAAGDGLNGSTGSAVTVAADVRGYVRSHPLQMLGLMVGIGYLLGKALGRSRQSA